jgi:hypothetical protein
VDTRSGVYHFQGEGWFGNTRQDEYLCKSDATHRASGQLKMGGRRRLRSAYWQRCAETRHSVGRRIWPKNEPASREDCGFDGEVKAQVLRLD